MATLTVTIPNPLVTELTAICDAFLIARNIDISAMSVTQRGQRYVAELLKDQLINSRLVVVEATAASARQAASIAAETELATARAAAITSVSGIVG